MKVYTTSGKKLCWQRKSTKAQNQKGTKSGMIKFGLLNVLKYSDYHVTKMMIREAILQKIPEFYEILS